MDGSGVINKSALSSDGPHGNRLARIVCAVVLAVKTGECSVAERPLRMPILCTKHGNIDQV